MRKTYCVHLQICFALFGFSQQQGMAQDTKPQSQVAAEASPAFEVASIRPSDPNDPNAANGWSCESEGRNLGCRRVTLLDIISIAYGTQPRQIVGGPQWLNKDRYDIIGVPNVPGNLTTAQMQTMYKKLLADRFHLVLHPETRQMPVYVVTVAKGGPLLKVADPSETVNTANSGNSKQRTLRFTNMSMHEFAENLNFYEDRPVIDQTSLPGRYDFTLKWTYEVSAEDQPGTPPSIFTAMREQLGLKMDAVKGPAEVLVIDRLERPSEN